MTPEGCWALLTWIGAKVALMYSKRYLQGDSLSYYTSIMFYHFFAQVYAEIRILRFFSFWTRKCPTICLEAFRFQICFCLSFFSISYHFACSTSGLASSSEMSEKASWRQAIFTL